MSDGDSDPAPVKEASSNSHEGRNIAARRSASSGVSRALANVTGAFAAGSAVWAMIASEA
jgi:hypothetical protein